LQDDPFRLTPDPAFFFPSPVHKEALLALDYVVQHREGFCMITGEPGTGKTTLINVFKRRWADRSDIALILTPRLSPDELLMTLVQELRLTDSGKTKNETLKTVRNFLAEKHRQGRQVIIIADEAHDMPGETLEELRLLSNLETPTEKLVQIILVGQPELDRRLKEPGLRQIDQRIVERMRIRPLTGSETGQYLNYRLSKAKAGSLSITPSMSDRIYRFSRGLPRLINLLASRSIMCAYMDGSSAIRPSHVRHAINYFAGRGYGTQRPSRKPAAYACAAICVLLAALLGAGVFFEPEFKVPEKQYPRAGISAHLLSAAAEVAATADNPKRDTDVAEKKSVAPAETKQGMASPGKQQDKNTVRLRVSAATASVRRGPGLHASVIGYVHKGDVLTSQAQATDSRNKTWYRIGGDGKKARWVSVKVVSVISN
jgi:general secretion pathway protein A